MKKIFFMLMAAISLFASSIEANKKSQILSVNKNEATIKPIDAPMGSSGIVIHHFDKKHATIVAGAELIAKNRIKFKVFDALRQDALPTPNIKPQISDEVVLNYLYDRAIAIAPNFRVYQEIVKSHQNIEWMHPDLFAAELSIDKNPAPKKEDFKKFCEDYSVGLLYFAIKEKGYFVDCYSFKKIASENIKVKEKNFNLPFYSRIKNIETNPLDFFSNSEIKNYNSYYQNLLELK